MTGGKQTTARTRGEEEGTSTPPPKKPNEKREMFGSRRAQYQPVAAAEMVELPVVSARTSVATVRAHRRERDRRASSSGGGGSNTRRRGGGARARCARATCARTQSTFFRGGEKEGRTSFRGLSILAPPSPLTPNT